MLPTLISFLRNDDHPCPPSRAFLCLPALLHAVLVRSGAASACSKYSSLVSAVAKYVAPQFCSWGGGIPQEKFVTILRDVYASSTTSTRVDIRAELVQVGALQHHIELITGFAH